MLDSQSLMLQVLHHGIGLTLFGLITLLAFWFCQKRRARQPRVNPPDNYWPPVLGYRSRRSARPGYWRCLGNGLRSYFQHLSVVNRRKPCHMASGATYRQGAEKPFIGGCLLIIGLNVRSKAFRRIKANVQLSTGRISAVAVLGGFMDSTGGGDWGPIVTTTSVGAGENPKVTIGSVNYAEFFLTITVAAALFSILDATVWILVSGLVVGGVFAAPFAAYATRHFSVKTLRILVGSLITIVGIYNLYRAF
jgi:hypothetical protein